MRRKWEHRRYLILLLLVIAVACGGCGTTDYKVPIGNYNEANSLVIDYARTMIEQANQVNRDIHIDRQVRHHEIIDLDGVREAELFSQDQLAARMKALDIMDSYGTLLLKIVNSDAPKTIAETSGAVAKDVTNLLGMIAKLQGEKDDAFKGAAGPVANIVSQVVDVAMKQKIRKALEKAVEEGSGPIIKLITVLDQETFLAYERKRLRLHRELESLLREYNAELQKGKSLNETVLQKYADQVKAKLTALEESEKANPERLFDAMSRAQVALLGYARSKKDQKDTSEFNDAMEDYLARVKLVGAYMKKLNE
jgi:hypothetical protein